MYGPHVSRLLGTQEGSVLCGPVNPLLLGLNALTGLLFGMFTTHPLAPNAHSSLFGILLSRSIFNSNF